MDLRDTIRTYRRFSGSYDIVFGPVCHPGRKEAVRVANDRPAQRIGEDAVWDRAEAALQESKRLLEQRVRERTHELHLANKELQAEIARRKGLEGEILEISDREQQRLGQEIHDGLCQHQESVLQRLQLPLRRDGGGTRRFVACSKA